MQILNGAARPLARLAAMSALAILTLFAQDYRATILGTITDSSGAVVPEAKVTLTNVDTSSQTSTNTNNQGVYTLPYLIPGRYRLAVQRPGFKAVEENSIEVRVSDRLLRNFSLQPGQLTERIEVTAQAPLLDSGTANRGQVVNRESLQELPVKSANPYTLLGLSSGVQYTGSQLFYRPFDNGAINSYSINGGRPSVNEFQLDGISNNRAGSTDVAYVPPLEATEEFKVQTNTYDSQYGRTGGGVVNVSVKSGTNQPHGTAYWYLRRDPLFANQFLNNVNGLPKAHQKTDQYGFEVDGPVYLPKLYRGRDKTFFMFTYEKWQDFSPLFGSGSSQSSVPSALERGGDFSNSRNSAGAVTTIYDPLTTRLNPAFDPTKSVTPTNVQYIRTPFPNNMIPADRLNPIALAMLKAVPLPNQPGNAFTQANNFLAATPLEVNDYYNAITRVDHQISSNWRTNVRWDRNLRKIMNPTGQAGWNTAGSNGDWWTARINDGAGFDMVGTLSPTTVLDIRVGFTRYNTFTVFTKPFDQSTLSFPASYLSLLGLPERYPNLSWENYSGTANPGGNRTAPSNTYTLQSNVTKVLGVHTVKTGFEYRVLENAFVPTTDPGSYNFTRTFTQIGPQVTDNASGNAIASFLLGDLGSATANINVAPFYSWHYPVLFFQDEWQVSHGLSLSLGLRWDYESPVTERYNRQLRGFDFNAASPVQIPGGSTLRGGALFAGANNSPRGAFNPDRNNFQPRVGVAWHPSSRKPFVLRAGTGLYYLPTTETGQTTGFTSSTTAITTTPDFKPASTLSNPFPNGLVQPAGSNLGLSNQLGSSLTFNNVTRIIPKVWQYSGGFEYQLWHGFLLELTYVGSRTSELQVGRNLNFLTTDQLALGTSYLNGNVTNPFYGVLPANTTLAAQPTIQRRSLLLPYPQFSGLTMNANSLGSSWYNSAQLRLERRFGNGLSLLASYTKSKTMEAVSYKNAQDLGLSRELTSFDVPQVLNVSGIYQFPLGPGRKWLNAGWTGRLLGGWDLSFNAVFQRGTPLGLPDYYITGNPALSSGQTLDRWFDTSPSLWIARPSDTLRTAPFRSPNIRIYSAPQADATLLKAFRITEHQRAEFRISAFNITNTPLFGSPNTTPTSPLFGTISKAQINLPRQLEVALRYRF